MAEMIKQHMMCACEPPHLQFAKHLLISFSVPSVRLAVVIYLLCGVCLPAAMCRADPCAHTLRGLSLNPDTRVSYVYVAWQNHANKLLPSSLLPDGMFYYLSFSSL
jgi:hypothetical protein